MKSKIIFERSSFYVACNLEPPLDIFFFYQTKLYRFFHVDKIHNESHIWKQ